MRHPNSDSAPEDGSSGIGLSQHVPCIQQSYPRSERKGRGAEKGHEWAVLISSSARNIVDVDPRSAGGHIRSLTVLCSTGSSGSSALSKQDGTHSRFEVLHFYTCHTQHLSPEPRQAAPKWMFSAQCLGNVFVNSDCHEKNPCRETPCFQVSVTILQLPDIKIVCAEHKCRSKSFQPTRKAVHSNRDNCCEILLADNLRQ